MAAPSLLQAREEAEDLAELLEHWARREAAVFRPSLAPGMPAMPATPALPAAPATRMPSSGGSEARGEAARLLAGFCEAAGVSNELPAMLTLFDALAEALSAPLAGTLGTLGTLGCTLAAEGSRAVLAAVARLALKFGPGLVVPVRCLGALGGAERQGAGGLEGLEGLQGCMVRAELCVVKVLDGRVWLPSPLDSARAILARLVRLATPAGSLTEAIERHSPDVLWWAALLIWRVAASAALPPRALAFGACVLGLDIELEGGPRRARGDGPAVQPAVTVEELAEAACCSPEGFRDCAAAALAALQAAGHSGPPSPRLRAPASASFAPGSQREP